MNEADELVEVVLNEENFTEGFALLRLTTRYFCDKPLPHHWLRLTGLMVFTDRDLLDLFDRAAERENTHRLRLLEGVVEKLFAHYRSLANGD